MAFPLPVKLWSPPICTGLLCDLRFAEYQRGVCKNIFHSWVVTYLEFLPTVLTARVLLKRKHFKKREDIWNHYLLLTLQPF